MKVHATDIEGCFLIEPAVFGDARGFFLESWNARAFAEAGLPTAFVQDNHSRSMRGVLRGLHYQLPNPQGKLVRVAAGAVFDVVVDLRRSSPSFGRAAGFRLDDENKFMLWAPPGLAHGFLTLVDDTHFQYKCTDYYHPATEHALKWNDPALGINWPLDGMTPTLSAKDAAGHPLADTPLFA